VTSNSLAPGIVATNFLETSKGEFVLDLVARFVVPWMARNLRDGAARGIQLLTAPEYRHVTGHYAADYLSFPTTSEVTSDNARWVWCVRPLLRYRVITEG